MIPNHMAIIVDGNGRWAKERGLSRSFGHKAGSENLEKIILYAKEKGIKILSLYILSCDSISDRQITFELQQSILTRMKHILSKHFKKL